MTRVPPWLRDGLWAAVPAVIFSGAPSTLHAWVRGGDILEAATAAGALVAPRASRGWRLVYAVPVHAAISLFWAMVFARLLPRQQTMLFGLVGGAAVAALDLGVIGRRFEAIRSLPTAPQVADHLAFGAIVAAVVARRRERLVRSTCRD